MSTRILTTIIISLLTAASASAQQDAATGKAWTLRQCVAYAIEHNINVKQIQNTREQQALQLSTDKNSRLPDLSANAAQGFSFGRGLTAMNTYENRSTQNTSFSLSSSIPLFDGMRIANTIKLSKLNLDAADADLAKARNDLSMNVAKAFIEVLNAQEISEVAERQISIDSMQVARLAMFLKEEKASEAELAQQKATLAQSRLTATTASNNYRMALLDLSQLLELPSPDGFTIARPDTGLIAPATATLTAPDIVYADALGIKPEIKAQQDRVAGAEHRIRIARSALMPQLNLNGSLGSNYYKTSGIDTETFGKQLKNNFSQYIGLSLSIPIFNRFATRNNIRSSRISRDNERLKLEDVKKNLYKEIQQVYYNACAARSKYISSQEAVASNESAFALTKGKYENGKASITEFNEAKNNLLKSQSDEVQAKYEYLYQSSLLDFYQGKRLDF